MSTTVPVRGSGPSSQTQREVISLREAVVLMVRLITIVRPYWHRTLKGVVIGLLAGFLALVPPYISKLYFDSVYPARDYTMLHILVIGVTVFTISQASINAIRTYYMQVVTAEMSSTVSLLYFNHLQHLPIRFFEQHRVGEIASRSADMRSALATMSRILQTLLMSGIYLILVPPFLLALNWHLAVISLIATPVTTALTTSTSRITRRFVKQSSEAMSELNGVQIEALNNIRTFKAMALEPEIYHAAKSRTEEALSMQLRAASIGALVGLANAIVRAGGVAIFTWYAWTLILRGELSLGSFVAFTVYLSYLTGPVGQVAGIFADFQQSTVALGRAFEYLDEPSEQDIEQAYTRWTKPQEKISGHILLSNVDFHYMPTAPVLQSLSAEFETGSVTAIVGPSGAGKSSLLRLLCAMERPSAGTIRFGGVPIDSISLADLRRQVGVVWQDPALIRGTLWDNLTLGADRPTRHLVDEAVDICQLRTLVSGLNDGYASMLGEWGGTVSGGQRQRIALARLLIRQSPILLLDETTSQIDAETEMAILRRLLTFARGATVIMVTHRLQVALLADRICVISEGRLESSGTHSELLLNSSVYKRMRLASTLRE